MRNKVSFIEVNPQDFWKEVEPHFERIYANRLNNDPSTFYSETDRENLKKLRLNMASLFSLNVLVKVNDVLVGWHTGEQNAVDSYYMRNSAILEEFRGRGYYEELLSFLIERLTREGFQVLSSTHHVNNPAILIPKLRQNFVITSTEINDRFGFLVTLKYFANPERRKNFGKLVGLKL